MHAEIKWFKSPYVGMDSFSSYEATMPNTFTVFLTSWCTLHTYLSVALFGSTTVLDASGEGIIKNGHHHHNTIDESYSHIFLIRNMSIRWTPSSECYAQRLQCNLWPNYCVLLARLVHIKNFKCNCFLSAQFIIIYVTQELTYSRIWLIC